MRPEGPTRAAIGVLALFGQRISDLAQDPESRNFPVRMDSKLYPTITFVTYLGHEIVHLDKKRTFFFHK